MPVTINGTTGIAGVDGSAGTPSVQGSDTNTGVFYPAADTVGVSTGGSERMRVDSSGNVGIGTSSPGRLLSLYATQPVFQITNAASGSASGNGTIQYQVSGSTDFVLDNQGSGSGGVIRWMQAGSERARIDSSGNLLVNTTSADARFVVVDSATSGWGARILKSSGGGTPQGLQVVVGQNSSNEVFQCAQGTSFTSPTNLFRITGNGGINTGTASVSPYNNTTASAANMVVSASGDLQRSTSSLKYKTDVVDSTHGLAEVLQLRPVTYKGKNDGDTVFGGLIAEEVDAVGLTEFVQYAEDGSPDSLAYGNMVSLLVKAIQELSAKVDAQAAEIAALKANAPA